MTETSVLCVDPGEADGPTPAESLVDESSVAVVERETVAAAKQALTEQSVDCLVTEYDLPDGTGMELISHVREVAPDTGCILYTDADRDLITAETETNHVAEFVSKDAPSANTRIAQLVRTTVEHRSQTAYPVPQDEQERLEAIAEYDLDSELFRSAVQRIADLAAAHFGVTQSSVNVITESTQEFLACHVEGWNATSRERSMCTYTILGDGVTVVKNAEDDPRFEGNGLIVDHGIQFYAGVPITTDDGLPIGTVCIYDETAREFTDDDEAYLELLADEARGWVDVLRRLRDAERTDISTEPITDGDAR